MLVVFEILTSILGTLMSFGHFFQAYKIWKNKSAKDVSLVTYSIFAIGTTVWTIYGVLLSNLPIIVSFGVGVGGSWLVVMFKSYYR